MAGSIQGLTLSREKTALPDTQLKVWDTAKAVGSIALAILAVLGMILGLLAATGAILGVIFAFGSLTNSTLSYIGKSLFSLIK